MKSLYSTNMVWYGKKLLYSHKYDMVRNEDHYIAQTWHGMK